MLVPWDQHEMLAEWYATRFGTARPETIIENKIKKSGIKFPSYAVLHVWSVDREHEHWKVDWGKNAHTRMCFETARLREVYDDYQKNGDQTSEIFTDFRGVNYFDLFDPLGVRTTVVDVDRNYAELAERFPEARFLHHGAPRIGVRNVKAATDWYTLNCGVKIVEEDPAGSMAVVEFGGEHDDFVKRPVILELRNERYTHDYVCQPARPYLAIHNKEQFEASYQALLGNGVQVSEMYGTPSKKTWSAFHWFDPDGNQINIW